MTVDLPVNFNTEVNIEIRHYLRNINDSPGKSVSQVRLN